MFQIIKSSVKDKEDKTKLALIYANVDEDDIRALCCSSLTWALLIVQCCERSWRSCGTSRTVASRFS